MKKDQSYQIYNIRLKSGYSVPVKEPYDLPFRQGIVQACMDMGESDWLVLGDGFTGFHYIPKQSIDFIVTGDVVSNNDTNAAAFGVDFRVIKSQNNAQDN